MKPRVLLLVLSVVALTGCARPRQFTAPDATKLNARQTELDTAVKSSHRDAVAAGQQFTKAATSIAKAADNNATATIGHSKEQVLVGEIKPGLEMLRTKVTDAVLREEIDALTAKFEQLQALEIGTSDAIAATGAKTQEAKDFITAGNTLQESTIKHLGEADAASEDIKKDLGPKYQEAVKANTVAANTEILQQAGRADREAAAKWFWFSATLGALVALAVIIYLYIKKR